MTEEPRLGMEMDLAPHDLAAGGRGVARAADGRVVFVAGALAGEKVLARLTGVHKDFLEAEALEVREASPLRAVPACPVYGLCGGCDLMHLAHSAQMEAKAAWVEKALRRLPGLPHAQVLASPLAWGYRNRVRLQVAGGRLGFFARASHALVEVAHCPVAAPEINALLPGLATLLAEPAARGLEWVEALAAAGQAYLTLGGQASPEPAFWARLAALPGLPGPEGVRDETASARPGRQPRPEGLIYSSRSGLTLRAWPGQFSQVNFAANELLVEAVLAMAGPGQGRSCLDLYAGAGNFSLPLAHAGWQVLAVEGVGAAVGAAQRLAGENGLEEKIEAVAGEAGQALRELARQGQGFHLVCLDPPRAGAKGLMADLVRLRPQRVIYVSCHPAALGRDAGQLVEAGYRPTALAVVDMFPQTGHVEAVLCLDSGDGRGNGA
jgi:23S rRNA (uracil1939-C5)-methyltransferase